MEDWELALFAQSKPVTVKFAPSLYQIMEFKIWVEWLGRDEYCSKIAFIHIKHSDRSRLRYGPVFSPFIAPMYEEVKNKTVDDLCNAYREVVRGLPPIPPRQYNL